MALLEYIIKTYTKPGELIVDNTMGSGSTGVAAINTGRGFIGIELDGGYYNAAVKRIKEAKQQKQQEAAKGSTDEKPAAKSVTESDTPQKKITLGSLFDGLGGWQLAAIHNGVKPVWSSEIEAFPMAITKKHFPDTLQLGDITKLDGVTLPPVDIICAGSPCQDLSTAGKRKGLEGERSGLFRKAIDIVYGMREATGGQYPKFFIWENVPGAFSSNKGADFQAVLEEISKAEIPMPNCGRWAEAGMVRSRECDIAWRVLDAQFWGVPQRRKRIFLIADFRDQQSRNTAVLFERESVPGNTAPGGNEGQGTAAGIESDTRSTGSSRGITASFYPNNSEKARRIGYEQEKSATIRAEAQTGLLTYDIRFTSEGTKNARGHVYKTDTSRTLDTTAQNPDGNYGGVAIVEKQQTYSFDSMASNSMKSSNPQSGCRAVDVAKTLDTSNQNPAKNQGGIAIREVYTIAGNTIDRQIQNGANGKGVLKDKSYTLNTIDRHAITEPICIGNGQMCQLYPQEKVGALNCMHEQQAIITAKEIKA